MKKVTGIGGIFFKCADPGKMNEWYAKHLGFPVADYGTMFQGRELDNPDKVNYTVWTPFKQETKYFEPSTKDFMINYRVGNLEGLVDQLRKDSVTMIDKIESVEYGKFVHIVDVEGNKVELWEPAD